MIQDKQLARLIFHSILSIMKNTLNLEELSYREKGRDDPRYKTFKKYLMEVTYSTLRETLYDLEDWGLVIQTEEEEDVKNGYADSPSGSGGSGFVNSEKLNNILTKLPE